MLPKSGSVVYAKDIEKISTFYSKMADLLTVHAEAAHVVLESASFQLVVVAIQAKIAIEIKVTTPPVRRENTPIKLVFSVPSISAARTMASQLGGELDPADREWKFLDCVVCDGIDPEGNVVQFRAHAV